jgi:dipeptidyl aminopeptidase/acylaminoacyl peptidase
MHARNFTLFLLLLVGTLVLVAQDKKNAWTVDDLVNQSFVSNVQFSPDGKTLVWTQSRGSEKKDRNVSDLWLRRLAQDKAVRLTRSDDSDNSPFFSQDGKLLYFLSSRQGGKSLWAFDLAGGAPYVVDSFPNGFSSPRWLDTQTLIYIGGEGKTLYEQELKKKKDNVVVVEDSVHMAPKRLFSYDLKTKERKRLSDNQFPVRTYSVSKDGKWVVSTHHRSPHYPVDGKPKPWYFLWNLEDGSKEQILEGYQTPGSFLFDEDGQGFFFSAVRSSDPEWQGAGVRLLYYYDLEKQAEEQIDLDWEWGLAGSYQRFGHGLLLSLANGPENKMALLARDKDGWNRQWVKAGSMTDRIAIMAVSEDYKRIAYQYSTASRPPEYRVGRMALGHTVEISSGVEFAQLNQHLEKKTFSKTEIVRWQGALGEGVNGILYYPHDYEEGRAYPLIVAIHGGPTGVDMDRWSDRWAYPHNLLTQRGTFILKPNYHGSGNHGQKWAESIKKHYYEYEIPDVLTGVDSLVEAGLVDRDSLGVMGWSNGAIIATMLTVQYPDMFKAATPGAGDVNWTSDYGTCRFGVTFDQSYFGGAPWDDTDGQNFNLAYIEKSPLFEMEKVKTPTLICHGSEDRAVPRDQGWEYYRALQQIGQTSVRFLWFPGQPHGLQKITHQKRKVTEELAWFDRYLFGTYEAPNESVKKGSPLLAMLDKQKAARDENGQFGEVKKKKLIPETLTVKEDSIAIGRFEVTNAQYKSFNRRHRFPATEANHPVMGLNENQVEAYLTWLSKLTGNTYRLPNETEAEALHKQARKVAAQENSLNYWAGYKITADEVAALHEKISESKDGLIRAVGSFKATKVGEAEVYDLGGNVAEMAEGGATYGYGAYDYVDPSEPANEPKLKGFRVILVL